MAMSSGNLDEPQSKEWRDLLDVCDDLRKIFGSMMDKESSFTIPQVVVVGDQSVGKSSLLELLSGFQLPAGTGIVTRCPIVLQIRRAPRERYEVEGEQVSLQMFESALHRAQARLVENECGTGRRRALGPAKMGVEVTANCVTTRVEGPQKRDITLVDLPGIQYSNTNLSMQIKEIIREYIKNPAAIILLVSQCSSDPTATEALQCAREVDENQERTICILTKPDELRDDDAVKMKSLVQLVEGKHEHLKFPRGVFITKARSGSDDKKSIEEIRMMEADFFGNHPFLRHCMVNLRSAGHEHLLNRMEELALKTMKSSLPKILEQVKRALERKEEELEAFDQSQFVEDEEKKRIILNGLISKITDRLKHVFESDHGKDLTICLEKFEMDVMAITKECAERLEEDVSDNLTKRDPLRPAGVINQEIIDRHSSAFIERLNEPAMELLDSMHSIVAIVLREVIQQEIGLETVRDTIMSLSESFERPFKKEVMTKLKESFEFENVFYFSQLTKFYGPTVQGMRSLDYNFTFLSLLENLANGDASSTTPLSHSYRSDIYASCASLNQSDDLGKGKKKEKKPSKPKDLSTGTTFTSYACELPAANKEVISAPKDDRRPRITNALLKLFINSTKSSNAASNERLNSEANSLIVEQEALLSILLVHHFLTGFRVAGNVGKLLLYHYRKKMPLDLRQKLECSMVEMSESLNPDRTLFEQLKMIQSDVTQLQVAKDKIKTAMKATHN